MRKALTATGLAVAAAAAVMIGTAGAQEADSHASLDMVQMRTDLEVMRRLLAKQAIPNVRDPHGSLTAFYLADGRKYSGVGGGSLYVAGDGAMFHFAVGFPVAPGEGDKEPDPETEREPTLWEEELAEVEGRPKPGAERDPKATYDRDKVRELEDRVLDALARFGGNIRQLGSRDHLTVVVMGTAPSGGVQVTRAHENGSFRLRLEALSALGSVGYGLHGVGASVMTIRVPVADVSLTGSAPMTADQLRSRAVIHRY